MEGHLEFVVGFEASLPFSCPIVLTVIGGRFVTFEQKEESFIKIPSTTIFNATCSIKYEMLTLPVRHSLI